MGQIRDNDLFSIGHCLCYLVSIEYMFHLIEFPSLGAILRGRLYLVENQPGPLPLVIMTHGYSATINGMVADCYAEVFCRAGLAVLLYDHRSFGVSEGEPRQQINKCIQARGYRDAISFATGLPEIDGNRIAIWGDSLSGAEAIIVGAIDSRVRAVVAQVPACGQESPPPDPNGTLFKSIRENLLDGDLTHAVQTAGPLPVVSSDQRNDPSLLTPLTAFRWFMEYGAREGTLWENWATVATPSPAVPFHPALCAPYLRVPLLMIIAREDEMPGADSQVARITFNVAPPPKQLVEIDGGHFGLLYYPSPLFQEVSSAQREFLVQYLQKEQAR